MGKKDEALKKADERRRAFAREYIIDLNASRAAEAVGSTAKDKAQAGWELLQHADTQKYIQEERAKRVKRTEIKADKVLLEIARLAFSDMRNVAEWGVDDNGEPWAKVIPSNKLTASQARAISEISMGKYGVKVKLHNKPGALHELALHLGLLKIPVEVNGKLTLVDLVAASMEPEKE
jgi:phage terminase small subunit